MKIGLFGVGHLGKIHLKCLLNTDFIISGFYDPDDNAANEVINNYSLKRYDSIEALIADSDSIDIVSPTPFHYEIAMKACMAKKHIFVEKPVTETVEQAKELVEMSEKNGVIIQVGHVERYNPAVTSLGDKVKNPRFIEGHRLAMFNPRGTDVSVVLDLMIHDLDMILKMVDSEVKNVYANGVCIVSKTPDICNARIEFENGCIANVTASRISLKNMRKLRIFQDDAYLSIDFLKKETQIVNISPQDENSEIDGMVIHTNDGLKRINIEQLPILSSNAIEEELKDFYIAIKTMQKPKVSILDGYKALKLANQIQSKIALQHETK